MVNKSWNFLKPGDVVDIIAPSSAVPVDNLLEYYQRSKKILKSIGLIARIPDDLIDLEKDPFSANSLEYRAKHIINAFTNTDSKAVWAIRGGYGAAKLIPFLEKIEVPNVPKLLMGFSDITALHLFVENKWNWNSIHCAVISQIIRNPKLLDELKPVLFGEQVNINYNQLTPLNDNAKKAKNIEGAITGGNLCLVQTSLATSWQINTKDKIIFLEDVGEKGYQIDRTLNHLYQAGVFKRAKALIFGEITPELEKDGKNLCTIAIENFSKLLDIPVLSLPIIGHNSNCNSPLSLGTSCNLTLGEKPVLTCLSGGTNNL
ncbi:MAG: LD-carboxypeptidase [Rickettsiales bacterium]|jgi:muramoyltetrapeptide carboxypeptidase|nr:LD-carboxypeptidase [Rickettsiales bacterium]